jgi:hypothetical protein
MEVDIENGDNSPLVNTVENNNWLEDSSVNIVSTTKILGEVTPMESYHLLS